MGSCSLQRTACKTSWPSRSCWLQRDETGLVSCEKLRPLLVIDSNGVTLTWEVARVIVHGLVTLTPHHNMCSLQEDETGLVSCEKLRPLAVMIVDHYNIFVGCHVISRPSKSIRPQASRSVDEHWLECMQTISRAVQSVGDCVVILPELFYRSNLLIQSKVRFI